MRWRRPARAGRAERGRDTGVDDDSSPDDYGKFSLNEDWTATIIGLLLLGACLLGLISADLIP